jgi:hypothetical protein
MDFAPYQSSPPEHARVLSPSPRASWESQKPRRYSVASPPPLQHPQPQRAWSGDGIRSPPADARYQVSPATQPRHSEDYFGGGGDREREAMVSEFDTSLGIRLDYEACLAYLALPPVGAIALLIVERKSDYVR